MTKQAVILAGGLGTRLGALTKNTPKPLLSVAGKPFLSYLIGNLRRYQITDIVLAVGYHADVVERELKDGRELGVKLTYCIESEPLGTGGAVSNCRDAIKDQFLLVNGDTLFDCNYDRLYETLGAAGDAATGVLALRSVSDVSRYGSVTMSGNRIQGFNEKGQSGSGVINGGVYLLKRSILEFIPVNAKVSLENDVFPELVRRGSLLGVSFDGYFLDIGLPETYDQAQTELPEWSQRVRA